MATPPPGGNDVVSSVVPYKNVPALVGYYAAVFSILVPGLGLVAMILGILGLVRANAHPEAKGKVHAWIAIVGGLVTSVGFVVLLRMASRGN